MNSLQTAGVLIMVFIACVCLVLLWAAYTKNRDLDEENDRLLDNVVTLQGEVSHWKHMHEIRKVANDRLRLELAALVEVNAKNAMVHRRDQVAAHYQNLALQKAQADLHGRLVDPELAAAAHSAGFMHLQRPLSEPATQTTSPSP